MKVVLIAPIFPFRGGIAHSSTDATKYELPERISPFSFKQYKVFWGD